MRKVYMLVAAFSLLFLASCQQGEILEPRSNELTAVGTEKESGVNFRKVGDPRDPSEFMTPEELKMVQALFNQYEGKTLKNQVNDLSRGVSTNLDESDIPVAKLDGTYCYINVEMDYFAAEGYFNTDVYFYKLWQGQTALGFSSRKNTNMYVSTNLVILYQNNCKFDVTLINTSGYNRATVTIPTMAMVYDKVTNTCEIQLNPANTTIKYWNALIEKPIGGGPVIGKPLN